MERYPIGEQDFKQLREAGCNYVDKTMYIHKLLATHSKYFFLSRPRKFGKSLFLSTLRYFFEGERELFKDLYIDSLFQEHESISQDQALKSSAEDFSQPYPVLYLDLNCDRYADPNSLDNVLDNTFFTWENKFDINVQYQAFGPFLDVEIEMPSHSMRFLNIIKGIHEKSGKKVVILVDEYDKPLVNNLNNAENFKRFSEKLAAIYSIFKSASEHIKFVLVTGVNHVSKFAIFSEINNLRDISLDDNFSDICGFTDSELTDKFNDGITELARKMDITFEAARKKLKLNYGGYQFTPEGSNLHNPWSVLNSLAETKLGVYRIYSEILTYIATAFDGIDINLDNTLHTRCALDLLDGMDIKSNDPLTLLFQNGYLTIKRYQPEFDSVVLGVPNREVRQGLFYLLLPHYVDVHRGTAAIVVRDIINSIELGEPEKLVENLSIFLTGASKKNIGNRQSNFNNALYILLKLIGTRAKTEFHISDDRVDTIIRAKDYIYLIDLKFNKDISGNIYPTDENNYILPFSVGNRPVFNISATFSHDTCRLDKTEIKVLFNNL